MLKLPQPVIASVLRNGRVAFVQEGFQTSPVYRVQQRRRSVKFEWMEVSDGGIGLTDMLQETDQS